MKLIFNDAEAIEIQTVAEGKGNLKIKIISLTREQIIQMFTDKTKTKKVVIQDQRTNVVYEGYTTFGSLTEFAGGLYEICIMQDGKSIDEIMSEALAQITQIQIALCDVYEMLG